MKKDFISSTIEQLQHYKSLADRTFLQIKDDQHLFWKPAEESNSIWILVKHLHGNMLSRFTDMFTTDGEKDWRDRDEEFDENLATREELMRRWDEGWEKTFSLLSSLSEEDLKKEVYLKKKPLSVVDYINQAVFHYIYHVGQIVYIGKMAVNENWEMLWGPKKSAPKKS